MLPFFYMQIKEILGDIMGLPINSGLDLKETFPKGTRNLISDVSGIRVGHVTLNTETCRSGVTAILPHEGNLFRDKVMANASVLNGFGKSIGILQVQELGAIETPILMTNTMSIGTAYNALCKYMLERNTDIGRLTGTVNCLVTECNDGLLNDIRGMHLKEQHVYEALQRASEEFEEGAVGGGTGMCCLGLKGGIGSSSRVLSLDGNMYTIGAIVMANFGVAGNLTIGGRHIRKTVPDKSQTMQTDMHISTVMDGTRDQGSIIMVIGTDLPLSERQLGRICKRSAIALGRTGSFMGNGSGDIAIAFSTVNRICHYPKRRIGSYQSVLDDAMDDVFLASVEAVEESIISALYHAETTTGVYGNIRWGLRDVLGI